MIKGEMIDDDIDGFYNARRCHSSIGDVSPIEYEPMFVSMKMAA
jgi:transposase InsO family protein